MVNKSKTGQTSNTSTRQSCVPLLWENADKTLLILDPVSQHPQKIVGGQALTAFSRLIHFDVTGMLGTKQHWLAFSQAVHYWDDELAHWLKSNAYHPDDVLEQLPVQVRLAGKRSGNCIVVVENADLLQQIYAHLDWEKLVKLTQPVISFVFVGYDILANTPVSKDLPAVRCRADDFYMGFDQFYKYYTARGVVADPAIYSRLYELTQGWLYAVVLLDAHLKHNHKLTSADIDLAITGFFNELDKSLFTDDEQEQRVAVLLSQFDEFLNQMAVEVTPFSESAVKRCLDKLPGKQYRNGGQSIALHPLIHNYLQTKLYKVPKKMRDACLMRAARWYWDKGKYALAIQCSTEAQDFVAVRKILQTQNVYELDGNTNSLCNALLGIKAVDMRKNPMLWVYLAVALFTAGRMVEASAQQKKLERYLAKNNGTSEQRQALGELHLLNGFLAFNLPNGVQQFKKAGQYLGRPSEIWNGQSAGFVACGSSISFAEGKGVTLLETVHLQKQLEPYVCRLCNNWGRGFADLSLAEYYYFAGEDAAVLHHAGSAVAQAMEQQQWDIAMLANYLLMKQHIHAGRFADAMFNWNNIYNHMVPQTSEGSTLRDVVDFTLYSITNQLYLSAGWIQADKFSDDIPHEHRTTIALYIRCVYKYLTGDNRKALCEIDEALGKTGHKSQWSIHTKLAVLKLMVLLRLDMTGPACTALADIYALVRKHGGKTIVIEYGQELAGLTELAKKAKSLGLKTPPKTWLNNIVTQGQQFADTKKRFCKEYYRRVQRTHGTTLTQTEYITLQMACIGYERREIAAQLHVNPKYITAVMNKICAKLRVRTADAAISAGMEMGIQNDTLEILR